MSDDAEQDRRNENQSRWEEASRCPRCKKPGRDTGAKPGRRLRGRGPVMIHVLLCETELCPWYNTTWVVQVNDDGSIPEPYSQVGPKQFLPISQESMTRLEEGIQAQLNAEVRGDGEIRNPYSR